MLVKTSYNQILGLDTLKHIIIISIRKLCSFLQFRHISKQVLYVWLQGLGLSLASSTITGYNIPSNDTSKN